jgi:hypothetical protein
MQLQFLLTLICISAVLGYLQRPAQGLLASANRQRLISTALGLSTSDFKNGMTFEIGWWTSIVGQWTLNQMR